MSGLQERGSVELPSPRVSCCAVRSVPHAGRMMPAVIIVVSASSGAGAGLPCLALTQPGPGTVPRRV